LLVKSYRWSYTDTAWAFSLVILTLGISGVGGGEPAEDRAAQARHGGRNVFSLSYLLGGLALHLGSIPLFYLGYSVVGGVGIGLRYVTPVSTVACGFPTSVGS
jgi:OFA family oxalate/formate antiporter-like MFS transporter